MKRTLLLALWLTSWATGALADAAAPLRLGVYDNPPMIFVEENGAHGFIVDVIRDFCRRQRYELRFVAAPFHELFDKLKRGEVDIIAPIAYNEERTGFLRYNSESVVIDWSVVITGADAEAKLLSELAGRSIGVVNGDHYAELFKKDLQLQGIRCTFKEYDDFSRIVADVIANRVDAGFIGRFGLTHILRGLPHEDSIKVMPGSYYHEPLFFGITPRQDSLLAELDAYLRLAKKESRGPLNRATERWLGQTTIQKRMAFLSRNLWWILLVVLGTIALFIVFNAILRRRVNRSVHEINLQKTYFENLFQIIPVGIVILDARHRVTAMNREFQALFGYSLEEIRGNELITLLVDDKTLPQAERLRLSALRGERAVADGKRRTKDGRWLDMHIIISPIVEEGGVLGIICIYLDLTERKRLEEEIAKAKNIESVGVLAGGIAHDFNNMLTGILGNISVATGLIHDERVLDILEKAEKASKKASTLTRQLLTFSKGGVAIKKVVFLPDLVRDAMDLVISGSSVRASLQVTEGIPNCEVDVAQVSQVIHNLLINARQAMTGGGTIEVALGRHRQPQSDSILPQGDYVVLTVTDHGPGIPLADQQRIFVPYFTTKKSGTGLGLAIAYSVVRKHNGHITVDSTEGRGAKFTVYLPASAKSISESPPVEEPIVRHARILLMDDEEIVREVFADMLRDTPFRLDLATDSTETLEKFRSARDDGSPYDLVFLDLTVPGDIGGVKTLEKIHAIDPQARAIAVSGYSVSEVSSRPGSFHFHDFLSKPFMPQDLLEIIARNLTHS